MRKTVDTQDRQTLENNGQFDELYMMHRMVARCIACPELGYPLSEARFASVEEWEAHTGLKFPW